MLAIELIGHRGYTCRAVENTADAVSDAWLAGADGVELDLRVSSDGVLFLFHDDKIDGRLVSRMSYVEISSVEKIAAPSFESILDLGPPPGYLVLDLKETEPEKYESLGQLIANAEIDQQRILVQSQSLDVLTAIRDTMPGAAFYYLHDLARKFPWFQTPGPEKVLAKIDGANLDGVSLKGRKFIDAQFVKHIKDSGYRVNVWTINDPNRAIYYRGIGVDGVITDAIEPLYKALDDERDYEEQCFGEAADQLAN